MGVNKQFYQLGTSEGVVKALKYINGRGIKIDWVKSSELSFISSNNGPIISPPKLPLEVKLFTNQPKNKFIEQVRTILANIRDFDAYQDKLKDDDDIIEIKNMYEER